MKYSIYILFITCFFSCKKDPEIIIIPFDFVNLYWDSVYVTITNHTHGQFSVPKTGLAGRKSMVVEAVDGDSLKIEGVLKPANKEGRHPLFLKEIPFNYLTKAPYKRTLVAISGNSGSFIEIKTQNTTNKYVTAMLVYNGKEDSLFTLEPIFASFQFQTIGYIKPMDTPAIKNPLVKFYFGQNPPFTTTISTVPLWGAGASSTFSTSEPYTNSGINVPIKQ